MPYSYIVKCTGSACFYSSEKMSFVEVVKTRGDSFFMSEEGKLANKALRKHSHLAVEQDDGSKLIIATATSHPKNTFNSVNLGPGLLKDPMSSEEQHLALPKMIPKFNPPKNLRVVPESDYYLQNKSQDIGNRLAKDNGNDKNIVNYYECVRFFFARSRGSFSSAKINS